MFSKLLGRRGRGPAGGEPSGERRGLAATVWETFLKENRVIPPVLAVVALLVFSWVVAGSFLGSATDESASNAPSGTPGTGDGAGGEVAQSEAPAPAPEIENPNAESFAVYESKDPFRQLFSRPSATTTGDGTPDGGADDGTGATDENGSGGSPGTGDGTGANGGTGNPRQDTSTPPGGGSPTQEQYEDFGDDVGDGFGDEFDGGGTGGGAGAQDGSGQDGSGQDRPRGSGRGQDDLFESGGDLPSFGNGSG